MPQGISQIVWVAKDLADSVWARCCIYALLCSALLCAAAGSTLALARINRVMAAKYLMA